jgi:hypothetical protein
MRKIVLNSANTRVDNESVVSCNNCGLF